VVDKSAWWSHRFAGSAKSPGSRVEGLKGAKPRDFAGEVEDGRESRLRKASPAAGGRHSVTKTTREEGLAGE
jgi:hypothetical protein